MSKRPGHVVPNVRGQDQGAATDFTSHVGVEDFKDARAGEEQNLLTPAAGTSILATDHTVEYTLRGKGSAFMVHRRKLRVKATLSTLLGLLSLLTAVWPDWIEGLTGANLDHGDGSVEWSIVVGLAVASVLTALLTYRD